MLIAVKHGSHVPLPCEHSGQPHTEPTNFFEWRVAARQESFSVSIPNAVRALCFLSVDPSPNWLPEEGETFFEDDEALMDSLVLEILFPLHDELNVGVEISTSCFEAEDGAYP